MSRAVIDIQKAGTMVSVKVGRYRESFDIEFLSREEVIDRALWAVRTARVSIEDETILELLRANRILP